MDAGVVACTLCPHRCQLRDKETGRCGTRRAIDGRLVVLTWGCFPAVSVDPVEKKPLFHFRPGSSTFSLGAPGCNMTCPFCQNSHLSQLPQDGSAMDERDSWTPESVIEEALRCGCRSISFTYSEPVLSLEFALETCAMAVSAGIPVVFVTNGQINPGPAADLAGAISAANVDLKSFREDAWRRELGGHLRTTLNTIDLLHRAGVWVEVTTLVVPGWNDSDGELARIAEFLAGLSVDIPWHVSRFHPAWRWPGRETTPLSTLKRAFEIGRAAGLRYVYCGNVPGDDGEKTRCPGCGGVVVDRRGYRVIGMNLRGDECISCGQQIAGVGFV